MATTSALLPPAALSGRGWASQRGGGRRINITGGGRRRWPYLVAMSQEKQQGPQVQEMEPQQTPLPPPQQQQQEDQQKQQLPELPEQPPPQPMARSKNMSVEYGGQWLSSVTRHVRIYAAYIDPVTRVFDQTQMDKLTLLLDTTNEFIWTPEACRKVYACFQELVDHYEGADLTEYTLRLIGSDLEHYIRKLLYDGEIKYNMDARTLNFSMGKPRVIFKSNQLEDVQTDK